MTSPDPSHAALSLLTQGGGGEFLIIARGSAQETLGRYQRFKHWLPEGTINLRTSLCREIIAILTVTIKKLRDLEKAK